VKRRIVIEMDSEDSASGIVHDVTRMVLDRLDPDVEFSIRQEMLPEKISEQIQVPGFLNRRAPADREVVQDG
jgi:hypothetical protein